MLRTAVFRRSLPWPASAGEGSYYVDPVVNTLFGRTARNSSLHFWLYRSVFKTGSHLRQFLISSTFSSDVQLQTSLMFALFLCSLNAL